MLESENANWLEDLTSSPRQRIGVFTLLGALVLFRAAQVVISIPRPAWGYDFSAYWLAAERVVHGQSLYTAAQLSGSFSPQEHFAYLYPPVLAVAIAPLTAVFSDYQSAMWLWATLGLLGLLGTTWLLVNRERLNQTTLIVLIAAILALPAVGFELVMGNVHLFLVALFIAAWLGVERRTPTGSVVAGIAIGLATLIKVFPIVVIAWFVLRRRYLEAVSAVATMALLAILTIPFVGAEAWLDYPKVLANLGPPPDAWSSIAPASLLSEVLGDPLARIAVVIVAAAILLWAGVRKPESFGFAVAVSVSILVVPTMYPHYLALFVAPLLLLAVYSASATGPLLAYLVLFVASQSALLDLREAVFRGTAVLGILALVAIAVLTTQLARPIRPTA